jgi:hypothetical protein
MNAGKVEAVALPSTVDRCGRLAAMDAFLDAETCAAALDAAFSGRRSFDAAMAEYQRARDGRVKAMYDFTCQLATLEPPPPEMQQLLAAARGNQEAMDAFAQMNAGTISPAAFFAPENVAAIIAAGAAASSASIHTGVGAAQASPCRA